MVNVAQSVEHQVVALVVVGSIPTVHPILRGYAATYSTANLRVKLRLAQTFFGTTLLIKNLKKIKKEYRVLVILKLKFL